MQQMTRAALAMALLMAGLTPAAAKNGASQQASMQVTGADADARGRVRFRVKNNSEGRFDLSVSRLEPAATYEILIGDVRVSSVTTSRGGNGQARFRSRPRGRRDEFLGFDPRGAVLVVRSAAGEDVLAASLSPDGSGADDGEIICCEPDDSGPECEDRSEAECLARGGTVTTATSCLPNPCSDVGTPPSADIICCVPDDSGPECEDRTVTECAAQGGVVVEATSCAGNPCAGIPPVDDDIRCCLPDDSGTECEDRTPAECLAQGGIDLGPGICAVDTCAGVNPGGTASVRVRCEWRDDRSKISVDGSGLAAGSYSARAISGSSEAAAGPQAAVLGQAEFDFDSDAGDIGEGATAIASDFLQGNPPQARGQILDASGAIVAEGLATCDVR